MKIPKIQKNTLKMYLNNRDTRISIFGPTIHVDWVVILVISFVLMVSLFWSSWRFNNDIESKIEGDDFVPRSKTINDQQLNRVIGEIDSKNSGVVNITTSDETEELDDVEGVEEVDLIDDNG